MFPQRNGLHSLHRTLSVLIFQLLLTHFCRGQSRLIGPSQPIVANIGDEIILPCHLEPGQDLVATTLEWTKSDMNPIFVHVRRARQDLLLIQHPAYKERTSISVEELKRGNISLKLSDVKPSDHGRYECLIPNLNENSFVDLVVASGAVSSPIIDLAGIDRTRGGVILNCESKGWYPEPEVFWLDGEGNLLSAGPTETVRGPDDLYTVSSRVTVEKSDNFTCRVQQKNINQTRETHTYVPDDFFEVQSSSSAVTVGLAVSLAVCILLILLLLFFVWRPNMIKTNRSNMDETVDGEKKNDSKSNKTGHQFVTEGEREREKLLRDETVQMEDLNKGKEKRKKKHQPLKEQQLLEEQRRREKAENTVKILKEELERTKKKELEIKQTELQQLHEEKQRNENELQTLKEELENKKKELETIQAALAQYSKLPFSNPFSKKSNAEEAEKKKMEIETLKNKLETQKKKLDTKIKEFVDKQAEIQQLQDEYDEYQKMESIKEFEDKLTKVQQELQEEKKRRTEAEKQKKDLEAKIKELTEEKQRLNKELETERKEPATLKPQNYQDVSQAQGSTSSAGQDSDTGHIIVDKVDPEGKYVRLKNMSDKYQPMRGWELHLHVNNRKPIMHTLEHLYVLRAKETRTVSLKQIWWSSGDRLLINLYSDTGELREMLEIVNSQIKPLELDTRWAGQDSDTGHIIVDEVDPECRYVRLKNMSDKYQPMRDWELHIHVNNRKPIMQPFGHLFVLQAKETQTVSLKQIWWSSGDRLLINLYSDTGEGVSIRNVQTSHV